MDGNRTRDLLQLWTEAQYPAVRQSGLEHFEMGRMFLNSFRKCLNASLAITMSLALPTGACAWGGNGQRVVVNQAIDTLPADLRAYFENNRSFLVQHVTDPLDADAKNPTHRHTPFIPLANSGPSPFEPLPPSYKAPITKYA